MVVGWCGLENLKWGVMMTDKTKTAESGALDLASLSPAEQKLVEAGASPDEAKDLAKLGPATAAEKNRATSHLTHEELALAFDPRMVSALGKKLGVADTGLALSLQDDAMGACDEIERMLLNQMRAMNGLALRSTSRAHEADHIGQFDTFTNAANKSARTFASLLDTLGRYRGKTSEQKVTVEHVHVHEGGQAIVGNVNAPGAGRGRRRKLGTTP